MQIAGEASNKKLPVGSQVSVEGTLFPAHTMWHVEQVLIDAATSHRSKNWGLLSRRPRRLLLTHHRRASVLFDGSLPRENLLDNVMGRTGATG